MAEEAQELELDNEIQTETEVEESSDIDAAVAEIGESLFGKKGPDEEEEKDEIEPEKEEKEEKEEEQEKEEEKPKVEVKPLPASWKKEMQATWESMTEDARDYVIQREEQMKAGLVKDREDAVIGRTMRDILSPYKNIIKQQNIDEGDLVSRMLNAHFRLATSPIEERKQMIGQLAESYGIKFGEDGERQEIDPIVRNLTNKINQLESIIVQGHQQAQQATETKVINEVNEFATSHPYFDDVSNEIYALVSAGYELQDAYDKAVWANPLTRQKELDRIQQEKVKEAQVLAEKKAEEARKAKSVNVRSRDTGKSPTAVTGSIGDTLYETLRAINQRTRS